MPPPVSPKPVASSAARPRRVLSLGSDDMSPFADASDYYGPKTDPARLKSNLRYARTRTMLVWGLRQSLDDSLVETVGGPHDRRLDLLPEPPSGRNSPLRRRLSADDLTGLARRFLITDIRATLAELLKAEDTDLNCQITIEDLGPKVLQLGTANLNGINKYDIRGTYMLLNLLQELTIAQRMGRNQMVLDELRLNENPVARLARVIKTMFWRNLTRQLDATNLEKMALDTKISGPEAGPRLYVPHGCTEQYDYYTAAVAASPEMHVEVEYLPEKLTPEFVKLINHRPGLLALASEVVEDPATGAKSLKLFPYVVPGGRFNELYGWDLYMIALGLLVRDGLDRTKHHLARGMAEHFIFEITHYGKILNANRSYYLCRLQPPFLTDMALQVYAKWDGQEWAPLAPATPDEALVLELDDESDDDAHQQNFLRLVAKHVGKQGPPVFARPPAAMDFLRRAFAAAIREYQQVWMLAPRLDPESGLSCYHPDGLGIPPETEASHFEALLMPYANKHGVLFEEFQRMYNDGEVVEPELDSYFVHDRAVRELGHDTSYRLEGKCAQLATIDLNLLLYRYEMDIGTTIRDKFDDALEVDGTVHHSAAWFEAARVRRARIDQYCWNEDKGMYFDYDTVRKEQNQYELATTFWALWAGHASQEQAEAMVATALPKLEMLGGLAAGTLELRGHVGLDRPSRQWDYPYGWAPQQILAWEGLAKYGFHATARRLVYRWLYLMTKAFVDYNGIVVEKYDVTLAKAPHVVEAEYGNQGSDFRGVATEGFGWVNASFMVGLEYLSSHAVRALGTCTPPAVFLGKLRESERGAYYEACEVQPHDV